jgi:hypothetical protein
MRCIDVFRVIITKASDRLRQQVRCTLPQTLQHVCTTAQRDNRSNTRSTLRCDGSKVQSTIDMSEIPTDFESKFSTFYVNVTVHREIK